MPAKQFALQNTTEGQTLIDPVVTGIILIVRLLCNQLAQSVSVIHITAHDSLQQKRILLMVLPVLDDTGSVVNLPCFAGRRFEPQSLMQLEPQTVVADPEFFGEHRFRFHQIILKCWTRTHHGYSIISL